MLHTPANVTHPSVTEPKAALHMSDALPLHSAFCGIRTRSSCLWVCRPEKQLLHFARLRAHPVLPHCGKLRLRQRCITAAHTELPAPDINLAVLVTMDLPLQAAAAPDHSDAGRLAAGMAGLGLEDDPRVLPEPQNLPLWACA